MNVEELPGYKKESFALSFNGGEIWFEHLDGMYDKENIILEKLEFDRQLFSRPSSTSYICFVFDETQITEQIIIAVLNSITENTKHFMKIAFSGVDKKSKHRLKKELTEKGFCIGFFEGLEDAKCWLLP